LTILAPMALLATAAAPAMAADRAGAALYAAPVATAGWADASAGFGFTHITNNYGSESKTDLWGEARVGTGSVFYGMPLQVDISGNTNRSGNYGSDETFDVAGHLGLFSMGGGSSLGIMVSSGSNDHRTGQRFTTIAGEGAWGLSALGGARLVVQGGWINGTGYLSATYLHGVIQAALSSNIMLSAGLGFAHTSDDESYTRYGAQADLLLNPTMSAFVRWDGEHKTEGSYSRTDNRVLFGGTIRVNEGNAAATSPFHDYNLYTGINSDFR